MNMFSNLSELKEYLQGRGYEDTIVLESPDYCTAAIGTTENGNVVYDFELMVQHLMEKDGMEYDDAVEFIEYNTIRAIPYAGEMAPVIIYKFDE